MAFNKYIQGLSRSGFRFGTTRVKYGTSVQVDLDDRNTQLWLSGWKENFIRTKAAGTVTVTSASPAVVSKNGHGFVADDCVIFSSTLTVPTGLTAGTRYFVIAGGLTANAFEVSATRGGAAINTTDTGTGTITVTPASADIVGITRRGFRIQDVTGAWTNVKVGSGVTKVDLTVGNTLRVLRRNYGRYVYGLTATSMTVRGIQDKQNAFDLNRDLKAQDVLTLDSGANNAANTEAVVIGANTYTFKTALTEAFATATVNDTAGTPADGNTVVVNGRTYTFKTALTPSADQVLINGGAGSMTNLSRAINQAGGTPGTDYVAGAANADVTASAVSGTTITLTAKVLGTAGNALTLVRVGVNLAVSGATFSGGVNSIANEVKVQGTGANSLAGLTEAINAGANKGTDYSTATVAHPRVSAVATATTVTLTDLVAGGDDIAVSTTAAHLSWLTAALTKGHDQPVRGTTVQVDATVPFNFIALRRHFRDYIEAD